MRLRSHLVILVLAALFPVLLFSGVMVLAFARGEQATLELGLKQTARALAVALDQELLSSIRTLEALATSEDLDSGNLAHFYGEARRVLETQKDGWVTIILTDPSGQQLLNLLRPFGAPLPRRLDLSAHNQVLSTGKPAVSNLFTGVLTKTPITSIEVPVLRDGRVKYVLVGSFEFGRAAKALTAAQYPPDWIGEIFDRNGRIVARTRNLDRWLGQSVPADVFAKSTERAEAWLTTVTREGLSAGAALTRSRVSGWTVALKIPKSVLDAPFRKAVMVSGAMGLAALLVGGGVAAMLGRRLASPIRSLAVETEAIGNGETPALEKSSVTEVVQVSDALERTAALLTRRAKERDEAHRRLGEALEREQTARAEAEAANRAKDEFLAVLSHELRTPLNAVYGWARMLRDGQLDQAGAARALDVIVRSSDAQVQLIDDLLDVSRVITGKMRLDVRGVDPTAVVEAAIDAVRPAAAAKEIRLQSVLDPRAGPITGDPDRLQQVVWNLLMNAVKFTAKRGRIQVHLQRVNSHVEIVVSDTGQGIPADVLPFVFDRFRQVDSSSTRTHTGLGLGLALVKHLVELHGGSVVAQSPGTGQGATFIVKLPLTIAQITSGPAPRLHPTAMSVGSSSTGSRLDGLRVLLVDDDPAALDLATAILTGAGAAVRACLSAPEALEVLRQWRPDVLVSDIEMPGEDGYSLIRKVRALDGHHGGKTPAVAMTAYGRREDRMRALTTGYSMHVPKPVDPGELTTIIASVAERPQTDEP